MKVAAWFVMIAGIRSVRKKRINIFRFCDCPSNLQATDMVACG